VRSHTSQRLRVFYYCVCRFWVILLRAHFVTLLRNNLNRPRTLAQPPVRRWAALPRSVGAGPFGGEIFRWAKRRVRPRSDFIQSFEAAQLQFPA
jgi:hypothetical protein